MRILRYTNGSVIIDQEHPSHSATINGKGPDEVLPFTEHNVRKYMGKEVKDLNQEQHNFHTLQNKSKKG